MMEIKSKTIKVGCLQINNNRNTSLSYVHTIIREPSLDPLEMPFLKILSTLCLLGESAVPLYNAATQLFECLMELRKIISDNF